MPIDPTRRLALLPVPGQSPVRPMFKSMGIAASGIAAQRQRMDIIAQNIANADVTRGSDGAPYKRRELILEPASAGIAPFGQDALVLPGISRQAVEGRSPFQVPVTTDAAPTFRVPVLSGAGNIDTSGIPQGISSGGEQGVRVAGVAEDQGEGRLVYEPGHPDADPNGYVRYPDIDTTQELVKLMDARRIYEANAAVFQTAKSMLRAAIDI